MNHHEQKEKQKGVVIERVESGTSKSRCWVEDREEWVDEVEAKPRNLSHGLCSSKCLC